jgi:hypothetical protein
VRPSRILIALLLAGCAVEREAPITDAALREAGEWTERDALARELLDADAPPGQRGRWPTRRTAVEDRLLVEVAIGDRVIYLPNIAALFGFAYEPSYRFVPAHDACVLVNPGRAPTVIAIDPDRPIVRPVDPTPERAFDAVERGVERDLRLLEGTRP